jgi:hypothetical protein
LFTHFRISAPRRVFSFFVHLWAIDARWGVGVVGD